MNARRYKHIFIDLDKTIWDFDRNAKDTFGEIYDHHSLRSRGIDSLDAFIRVFTEINDMFWGLYRENKVKKEVMRVRRFEMTLNEFGIDDLILATHLADDYVTLSPLKTHLLPHAREALGYLKTRYPLHLITNGFEEVQQKKMDVSDLRRYFDTITTSEEAGVKKPEKRIFEFALHKAGAAPGGSLMIGDDLEVDIRGARQAGMDTMYYNPSIVTHGDAVNYEIHSWKEVWGVL